MQSVADPAYRLGFFFFMDIIGTFSLILDIGACSYVRVCTCARERTVPGVRGRVRVYGRTVHCGMRAGLRRLAT
jgi:hypothetical protein